MLLILLEWHYLEPGAAVHQNLLVGDFDDVLHHTGIYTYMYICIFMEYLIIIIVSLPLNVNEPLFRRNNSVILKSVFLYNRSNSERKEFCYIMKSYFLKDIIPVYWVP